LSTDSDKTSLEIHFSNHFLEHEYARSGGDFFIGKFDFIVHVFCPKT